MTLEGWNILRRVVITGRIIPESSLKVKRAAAKWPLWCPAFQRLALPKHDRDGADAAGVSSSNHGRPAPSRFSGACRPVRNGSSEDEARTPDNFFAKMLLPALSSAVAKSAGRKPLWTRPASPARWSVPPSLMAPIQNHCAPLVPQMMEQLPQDVMNGQPLHYQPAPDGRFVLYSVGWNQTDDGGKVVLKKSGDVDFHQGDWVWP